MTGAAALAPAVLAPAAPAGALPVTSLARPFWASSSPVARPETAFGLAAQRARAAGAAQRVAAVVP